MIIQRKKPNKIFSALLAGFLICSFILTPISATFEMRKAEALTVYDPTNYIANYGTFISSASTKASSWIQAGIMSSLKIKEFSLDAIGWALGNIVIKEMLRSTTQWVKSGFKGSPAFVTDMQGFLLNIADKVAGNFIYGTPLSALCSPFSLNIKLALDLQYQETRTGYVAQCRLSRVIGNVDRFLQGDFMQGGWDGWYNVALTPANNPYGAMLEAQGGLSASIAGAQGIEMKFLEFGRGMLSVRDPKCTGEFGPCPVVTPGAIVETQVNETLGLPAKKLAVADEINELVGALMAQLANQALSGAGGLLGLTTSSNGAPSYISQMTAEQVQTTTLNGDDPMMNSITDESKYLGFQTTIINLITDASLYKSRVYDDSTCSDGDLTNSLSSQLSSARRAASSSSAIIANLTIYQADYSLLQNVQVSTSIVDSLLEKYKAQSIPEAQSKIMEQFLQYQSSGAIHNGGDLINLELTTLPGLREEIAPFTASIDRACEERGNNNTVSGD